MTAEHIIPVCGGVGTGPTRLAAFDRALASAGASNANLVPLSSIVPPAATVVRRKLNNDDYRFGDRLYCVLAECSAVHPGESAWAGLAWAIDLGGGGGVFVEAHGISEDEVRAYLRDTVDAMIEDRPSMEFSEVSYEVIGTTYEEAPTCALVIAAVGSASWLDG